MVKCVKLSGEWLWPPAEEVDGLVQANVRESPVETVMRFRALTEISRHMDSETLAALAALAATRSHGIDDLVGRWRPAPAQELNPD